MGDAEVLLTSARRAIAHGLEHEHQPPVVDVSNFEPHLTRLGASFVSLHRGTVLRGCIGTLEARRPLISDVVVNACNAAFRDPRFSPLRHKELAAVHLEISLLSEPERMSVSSETELIAQLRPGMDGLILQESERRGTFLPVVWESIPEASRFLRELKRKAGLPARYWSDSIEVWRYHTELIREL